MKFLFLIEADENTELGIELADVQRWFAEIDRRGARLIGGRLEHTSRALCVFVEKGKPVVTDGPFAETKDAIGGFDVIECASREAAAELAGLHPVARFGSVLVRPLIDESLTG